MRGLLKLSNLTFKLESLAGVTLTLGFLGREKLRNKHNCNGLHPNQTKRDKARQTDGHQS